MPISRMPEAASASMPLLAIWTSWPRRVSRPTATPPTAATATVFELLAALHEAQRLLAPLEHADGAREPVPGVVVVSRQQNEIELADD